MRKTPCESRGYGVSRGSPWLRQTVQALKAERLQQATSIIRGHSGYICATSTSRSCYIPPILQASMGVTCCSSSSGPCATYYIMRSWLCIYIIILYIHVYSYMYVYTCIYKLLHVHNRVCEHDIYAIMWIKLKSHKYNSHNVKFTVKDIHTPCRATHAYM